MLPLTKSVPKCLLKINGKTILQHQIDILKKCGIENIVIVAGHNSENIERLYGKELKFIFNPFDGVSGMAMSLWLAKDDFDGDVLVIYSDVLFNENIVKKLLNCPGTVSLAVDKNSVDMEAEKVKIKDDSIIEISKTEIAVDEADAEFIGLIKFRKDLKEVVGTELRVLAQDDINSYLIDLIRNIINKGIKIIPCDVTDELWIDIDFPEDLEKAKGLNFI
jgi:choline kinase